MAQLIVEAGGATRRFKVGDGKLTIGSGDAASVTVESEELAEIHAEIEITGDDVVLRTRKGVTPPQVGGRKATGDVNLEPGKPVTLGDIKISVGGAAPAAKPKAGAAKAGATKSGAARSGAKAGAAKGAARPASGGGRSSGARVQRTRPVASSQSVPSWLIVVGILAVAGVGFLMFKSNAEDQQSGGFDAKTSQHRLQDHLDTGRVQGAVGEMAKVRANWADLSPEWQAVFEKLEDRTEEAVKRSELLAKNVEGDKWFTTQIKKFSEDHLAKNPNRPYARVLMKRLDYFEKAYPLHPEVDALCARLRDRWSHVAKMNEPPTFDDIEVETKTLTWYSPRDYRTAFEILDKWLLTASGGQKTAGEDLRASMAGKRKEYFDDRIQQAKWDYGQPTEQQKVEAVGTLMRLVTHIGDPDMENFAADILINIPGVDTSFAGLYLDEDRRPEYTALMRNKIVRDWAEKQSLLEGYQ